MGTWKVLGKFGGSGHVESAWKVAGVRGFAKCVESAWVWALQSCGGMWACKVRGKCVESLWKVRRNGRGTFVESWRV